MTNDENHTSNVIIDLMENIIKTANILDFSSNNFFKQFNITRVQYAALCQIIAAGEDGISLTCLSEEMLVSKANITTLVDRMEAVGFIKRISHSKDRRSTLVVATEKGKQCADEVLPERMKLFTEVFACLSKEEFKIAGEVLSKTQTSMLVALKNYL